VETNGINVIADGERKGKPADLFWPWFAANVSVFGISYGAFTLAFGISFFQALVVGIVFSFLLCGLVAVAGKRGSAPTMVLSRAAFGVRGNRLPDHAGRAGRRVVRDHAGRHRAAPPRLRRAAVRTRPDLAAGEGSDLQARPFTGG
jgi:hypothetical protein